MALLQKDISKKKLVRGHLKEELGELLKVQYGIYATELYAHTRNGDFIDISNIVATTTKKEGPYLALIMMSRSTLKHWYTCYSAHIIQPAADSIIVVCDRIEKGGHILWPGEGSTLFKNTMLQ